MIRVPTMGPVKMTADGAGVASRDRWRARGLLTGLLLSDGPLSVLLLWIYPTLLTQPDEATAARRALVVVIPAAIVGVVLTYVCGGSNPAVRRRRVVAATAKAASWPTKPILIVSVVLTAILVCGLLRSLLTLAGG